MVEKIRELATVWPIPKKIKQLTTTIKKQTIITVTTTTTTTTTEQKRLKYRC